jgi:serine protease Do
MGAGVLLYSSPGWRALPFVGGQRFVGESRSEIGVRFGNDGEGGALIDGIDVEGSPADLVGLIGGDVIVEAGGQPIAGQGDMRRVLASMPPGSQLGIKFLRDGQQRETVLVTAKRSDFQIDPVAKPHGFFGIDPDALKRVRVPDRNIMGVRLGKVYTNSPADVAGIRQGDVVIEFGVHPVRTPRELIHCFNRTKPYSTVDVKVVREGEDLVIPVKMGQKD